MSHRQSRACPECVEPVGSSLDRRDFIRTISTGVAGVVAGASLLSPSRILAAPTATSSNTKPAESLVQELFATLTDDQKKAMTFAWDHGAESGMPTRLKTYNAPPLRKRLGEQFTKPQQELIRSTLKAILSGDEAFDRLARGGNWDGAGSFEGNGVAIYGDPSSKQQFSWIFAGHHLTLRCDGNSQPNAAFGGPMYYGHSANGYSDTNVYNYQTKQVKSVFDALTEKQREQAVVVGNPGDAEAGLKNRAENERKGVHYSELDPSQRDLVASVMRTLLGPFRKEDGDEVMQLIKNNGGMEKIQLAFYKTAADKPSDRWDYWRLEGPGFVWNYRVLPHVHCYVNIVGQA
jgi:hypothetical protein